LKNEDLYNALLENKNRNSFYKKETILIGFMTLSIFLFMFGYFEWKNLISLTFFCLSISSVTLILRNHFKKREVEYFNLINEFIAEQEESITSEIRRESEDILTKAEAEIAAEELIFEKRVANVIERNLSILYEPEYPFNTPISKILKQRTEERKKSMKLFNYKFENSMMFLEEIENQPAYKRMGIEIGSSDVDFYLMSPSKVVESYFAIFSTSYIDHICTQYYHQKIDKEQFRVMYIIYYDFLKKNHPTLIKSIDKKLTKRADILISRILNE
jgi:hypothetical protein|tara:strand:- start:847 stop:1665 length:819 start_codon:yes stop_codon:yes gene_type:complete